MTFGVVFALAVPVAATPGDEAWCVGHPDHPKCVDEPAPEDPDPVGGTPCEEVPDGVVEDGNGVSTFTVELGGRKSGLPDGACLDVMSDKGAWTVEVEVLQGTLRSMAVHIRDSVAPGDGCFPGGSCGLGIRDIPESPFTLTLGMEEIPEAYVNACNVFEDDNYFGEWANGIFYVDEEPGIPSPLAFIPSISGSNDLRVMLTVTFPTYSTD